MRAVLRACGIACVRYCVRAVLRACGIDVSQIVSEKTERMRFDFDSKTKTTTSSGKYDSKHFEHEIQYGYYIQ